jgi:hypothetical protein
MNHPFRREFLPQFFVGYDEIVISLSASNIAMGSDELRFTAELLIYYSFPRLELQVDLAAWLESTEIQQLLH